MPVGWKHSHAGIVRKALLRRRDPEHWRRSHQIKATFDLPHLPRAARRSREVWAIFLVKNELDILPHTLQHTLEQGVDRILVVDNGSKDGTVDMVRDLATHYPIELGFDREPAYYQSHKMTYLARWATSRGAGWIVPMDADEFWFAEKGSLGAFLRASRDDIHEAQLYNLFPTQETPYLQGLSTGTVRFDHATYLYPKVALRASHLAWLGMGNHYGLRPGTTGGGLLIAHMPWRSLDQYARKVRQGAAALAATTLDAELGGHWRRQGALSDEEIGAAWERLLEGRGDESEGWTPRGPFSLLDVRAFAGGWPADLRPQASSEPS